MGRFTINKGLLPLKAQYFLWNAGTAPIVPFMPTYARQLGLSSIVVGIIYSILPVAGLLAKPISGAVADRLQKQKIMFILFQFITAVAFFNIQFLPEIPTEAHVQLDCGFETFFKVCNEENADGCTAQRVMAESGNIGTIQCQAKCNVTEESLWNELCTSWHLPQYCPIKLKFTAHVLMVHTIHVEDCMYLRVQKAIFPNNDAEHVPFCKKPSSSSCQITCDNTAIEELIESSPARLDCGIETNLKLCNVDEKNYGNMIAEVGNQSVNCKVECDMTGTFRFQDVCTNWKVQEYCSSNENNNYMVRKNDLEFILNVPMNKTLQEGSCTYFKVDSTIFPDGSSPHIPYCNNRSSNTCQMECNNVVVNDLIKKQATSNVEVTQLYQFWLFFILLLLSWIGMAVVVSVGDAICFEMLGTNTSRYGNQRLWGAVGWGIFSIIAGVLVDEYSKGETTKNYTPVFYLMLVMILLDMLVSSRLKYTQSKMSSSIVRDVGKLLGDIQIVVFMLWCIFVGLCTAMVWNFLFWHLEDLASADGCDMHQWIKTLEGLVMGIQCFGGELPFFFLSGWILDKIGHIHAMTLVLFGFGIRFLLYSFLVNPWWCLPIEFLQGITFGIFYSTMASYASIVAPPGTEATIQGLVGAIFEGIGVSLGSLLGGVLFSAYGGAATYRMFGIAALIMFVLHAVIQYILRKRRALKDFATSAHYATPNDALHMLQDNHSFAHT